MKIKGINSFLASVAFAGMTLLSSASFADTSVEWTDPVSGSSYASGTPVTISGNASTTGASGSGLDLVLVLDSSGSMGGTQTSGGVTQSLRLWQQQAAIALVNNLPLGTTSVSVVEFDSDANTIRTLTSLETNIAAVIAAINSVDASGGTDIGEGIEAATAELISARHTAGRSQQMVVMSDGVSSGNPVLAAAAALTAGVDAVHSVALPGSSIATMTSIATAGNGILFDARTNLSSLIDAFSDSSALSGLDRVDITLADGSVLTDVATDALGNFSVDVIVANGVNTFIADAYGNDGTTAQDTLILNGTQGGPSEEEPSASVPEPASLALLGLGLAGLGFTRRRKSAR